MNEKLKMSLMLLILVILMPIFTGCPDSGNKDLKVTSVTANGKTVKKDSAYIVNSNLSKVRVNLQLEEKVASYQLIQYEFTSGTSNLKNTEEYKCYTPKTLTPYEELKSLSINNDYKLQFKLYESNDCSDKPYQQVEEWIHTYEGFTAKDLIKRVGGKEHYCNVDANGNFRILYNTNLFAQIAYSQRGYYYKYENTNLNKCSYYGVGRGNYSKYSKNTNVESMDLDFIKWVAKKADLDIIFKDTVDEQINWAKNNGRWYTDVKKIHDGDLRVFYNHTEVAKQISIIVFDQYSESFGEWKDIYSEASNSFEQPTPCIMLDYIGFAYDSKDYVVGVGGGIAHSFKGSLKELAIGFISMKGIAY